MKKRLIYLLVFMFALILSDQLVYIFYDKPALTQFQLNIRHSGGIDEYHAPTKEYVAISNDSLYKEKVRFRTSKLGAILPIGGKGTQKVFFIGGSTTETHWVPENQRWPFLVGESPQLSNHIRTYNFGVGGYNLHQNFQKYITLLAGYGPQYIVIMNQANDMGKAFNGGYYNTKDRSLHNSYDSILLENRMIDRCKDLTKVLLPYITSRIVDLSNASLGGMTRTSKAHTENMEGYIHAYLKRLELFYIASQEIGAKLILINQPNCSSSMLHDSADRSNAKLNLMRLIKNKGLTATQYLQYLKEYEIALLSFAKKHKVPLLDLNKILPKANYYFYDSIHFTPKGSEKVAQVISSFLVEEIFSSNQL